MLRFAWSPAIKDRGSAELNEPPRAASAAIAESGRRARRDPRKDCRTAPRPGSDPPADLPPAPSLPPVTRRAGGAVTRPVPPARSASGRPRTPSARPKPERRRRCSGKRQGSRRLTITSSRKASRPTGCASTRGRWSSDAGRFGIAQTAIHRHKGRQAFLDRRARGGLLLEHRRRERRDGALHLRRLRDRRVDPRGDGLPGGRGLQRREFAPGGESHAQTLPRAAPDRMRR